MGWSGVSIVIITILLIGVIMAVTGVILLMTTREVKPWYDWVLIGVGVAVALFGGLLLSSYHSSVFIHSEKKTKSVAPAGNQNETKVNPDQNGSSQNDSENENDIDPNVPTIETFEPNFEEGESPEDD